MGENSVCLRPPPSPLGDAVDTLEVLINDEERDCFYASLDQLPDFDTRVASDDGQYGYTIDEEDWQWLATAVGTKSTQELVQFAHDEHERMALNDPDLVRPPNLCIFSFRSLFFSELPCCIHAYASWRAGAIRSISLATLPSRASTHPPPAVCASGGAGKPGGRDCRGALRRGEPRGAARRLPGAHAIR